MKKNRLSRFIGIIFALSTIQAQASEPSTQYKTPWSLKPYLGLSQLSDTSVSAEGVDTQEGVAQINLDTGFVAGIGLQYQFNTQWSAEFAWEYRSNNSEATLPNKVRFTEGNYASSLFFLNARYHLPSVETLSPYVGAGLVYAQEIDIDLEQNDIEQSYSSSGEAGYQLFTGVEIALTQTLKANAELRYSSISGIDMSGEENAPGELNNADYDAMTLQLGFSYHF